MDYILSGNPHDVQKVIQENRIRSQRGVIKFTPLADAVHCDKTSTSDNSEIEMLKKELAERDDVINTLKESLSESSERANNFEATINRLMEAGVDIALILDTPTEDVDVKVEPESDTKAEPEADNKVVDVEDCKEPASTPEADTKTTKAKRSKKSE